MKESDKSSINFYYTYNFCTQEINQNFRIVLCNDFTGRMLVYGR